MNVRAVPAWEPMLVAYLTGNCDLSEIYTAAKQPLTRMVGRIDPFLPKDLHEDVMQQVFLRLIENPPKYDAGNCTVPSLLFGLMRNAVKQVRAMFAPPGQRTRPPKMTSGSDATSSVSEASYTAPVIDPESVEAASGTSWSAEATTATVLAHELLQIMPQNAADAVWLVYAQDYSIVDAARALNKSRFSVRRSLDVAQNTDNKQQYVPPQSDSVFVKSSSAA